jgi:hypothetical protein
MFLCPPKESLISKHEIGTPIIPIMLAQIYLWSYTPHQKLSWITYIIPPMEKKEMPLNKKNHMNNNRTTNKSFQSPPGSKCNIRTNFQKTLPKCQDLIDQKKKLTPKKFTQHQATQDCIQESHTPTKWRTISQHHKVWVPPIPLWACH